MVPTKGGLESALAATEERVDAALSAVASVMRELRRAKVSASRGQVRDLRRALEASVSRVEEVARVTADAAESFDVDEHEHLATGGYAKELLAEAAARDVAMFEADERLLCYPSLIKVLPADAAVEVDRRRERRLRPSVLVRAARRPRRRGHRGSGPSRSWRAWRPATTWCGPASGSATASWCGWSTCGRS